jgi:hypothetical protein
MKPIMDEPMSMKNHFISKTPLINQQRTTVHDSQAGMRFPSLA